MKVFVVEKSDIGALMSLLAKNGKHSNGNGHAVAAAAPKRRGRPPKAESAKVVKAAAKKPGRPAKAKAVDADAPWGRKADGTPKKRPGRPAAAKPAVASA